MPEIPEITNRAREMKSALTGKTFQGIQVLQPKSLNLPEEQFVHALTGAEILDVSNHGKWILVETDHGWLLLNLGMGGEILLVDRNQMPEKYRLAFDFNDGSTLAVNFWWFGYAHFAAPDQLGAHEMTAKLGPNVTSFSAGDLKALLRGQRKQLKSFLLDQSKMAGIGNAYIHDILFLARLHPLRKIDSLSEEEIEGLWQAIQDGLRPAMEKGGAFYEQNLFGQKGGFTFENVLIGYREGQPCPNCGTPIEKIKTGSTTSFICPNCQKL